MSQAEATSTTLSPGHGGGHDDHGHGHPSYVAHHFESAQQQLDSAKLGMWTFLATELLMFGGLFCAYAIWRAYNYEAFEVGHVYLDTFWGAFNTTVLIASSFTMAWAVRAIQLGNQKLCLILLTLTFLGGLGFMCVKYEEYTTKFDHGMGPGRFYSAPAHAKAQQQSEAGAQAVGGSAEAGAASGGGTASASAGTGSTVPKAGEAPGGLVLPEDEQTAAGHGEGEDAAHAGGHGESASSHGEGEGHGEAGESGGHGDSHGGEGGHHFEYQHTPEQLRGAYGFFSIYFLMTGLHGIHVLVGMGLIGWMIVKTAGGAFGSAYNTPVDMVGLYWHLVDLIWIFLFPLFYLI